MKMKMRTRRTGMVFGIALTMFGILVRAQGADPIVGTWVLNVAKSTFGPGPIPKSESRTYVMEGQETRATFKGVTEPRRYVTVRQEIKATSVRVDSDGRSTTEDWTVVYDGRDRPVTGNPDADMRSQRRIDPSTTEFTQKKNGKVVIIGTEAISTDGRVLTITTRGTNARGETINGVVVFEKQ